MEYQPSVERYDRMQYKNCGNSGLLLPRISLGLWHNFGSVDDFGIASDMIKYAFDNGVTHFDLANNYGPVPGSAETNFGKILKENFRGYRDEMIISSKAGHEMWAGPYGGNSVARVWNILISFIVTVMMGLLRWKKPFRH